jgi:hypothetical protein
LGLESEKEISGWKKTPNEELREVYCSPDIVMVFIENGISQAGIWHAWGRREMRTGFLWGNPKVTWKT